MMKISEKQIGYPIVFNPMNGVRADQAKIIRNISRKVRGICSLEDRDKNFLSDISDSVFSFLISNLLFKSVIGFHPCIRKCCRIPVIKNLINLFGSNTDKTRFQSIIKNGFQFIDFLYSIRTLFSINFPLLAHCL